MRLLEDDALIRTSTADMLIDLGHFVFEATSGEEAIDILNVEL